MKFFCYLFGRETGNSTLFLIVMVLYSFILLFIFFLKYAEQPLDAVWHVFVHKKSFSSHSMWSAFKSLVPLGSQEIITIASWGLRACLTCLQFNVQVISFEIRMEQWQRSTSVNHGSSPQRGRQAQDDLVLPVPNETGPCGEWRLDCVGSGGGKV